VEGYSLILGGDILFFGLNGHMGKEPAFVSLSNTAIFICPSMDNPVSSGLSLQQGKA
jgi:hypothetical protein